MEGVKLVLRTALSGSQTKVLLSFVNPKRKVLGRDKGVKMLLRTALLGI